MHIRPATIQDNDELQAQCPMGTSLVFSTVNTPDFFARARAYADCQVFVACRDERITVQSLNLQLRLLGWALGAASRLRPMPRMVWPGQTMKQWALTPIAFKQPRHLAALLRRVNNLALQSGVEQLTFIGEKDHAMFQSIQGFFKADVQACLYVKPLDPGVSLSDAPVYIDGVDL
jgi:hypothetical protein